jgi:Na+-driven multidrug efflux pump
MISQAIGNIFATGGSAYISRMLGSKNIDEARETNTVSVYCAFGIGLVCTAVLWIVETPIIHLIGASEETFAYTNDYFSVVLLFIAVATAGTAMSGQMRSEGAATNAMILQMIGIVLNIALDPISMAFGILCPKNNTFHKTWVFQTKQNHAVSNIFNRFGIGIVWHHYEFFKYIIKPYRGRLR